MSGKVLAVMSAIPGNGAKYVATNLAKAIRERNKGLRVLLIDFDFDNPFLAYPYVQHDNTHGIDNLLPHIHNGLSEEIFRENVISTKLGVDVLRGTQFVGRVRMFAKNHVESILDVSRKLYDVVLVVIMSTVNNAGTVYTLLNADQLILVLRNNYANELKLDKVCGVISHYYASDKPVLVVYNFQNYYGKAEMNDKLQSLPVEVKVVGVLEYDERTIDNLDLEKKLKNINAKTFHQIAKQLA